MSIPVSGLFFLVVALGFTVSGMVGFGANVLALPILSMFIPIKDLVVIFAAVSFVNAIYRVIENHKGIIWKEFIRLILISMAGTCLGLWIFRILPENWLKLCLGCFVIAMAIYNLWITRSRNAKKDITTETWFAKLFYHVVLFLGGVLHGSFICGGPMYVIYCNHYYGHNRLQFRGMQFGIVFINSMFIILSYLQQALYTKALLLESGLGVLALLVAFFLSAVLLKRIQDNTLYNLVQIVLLISGASLAGQAAMKLFG